MRSLVTLFSVPVRLTTSLLLPWSVCNPYEQLGFAQGGPAKAVARLDCLASYEGTIDLVIDGFTPKIGTAFSLSAATSVSIELSLETSFDAVYGAVRHQSLPGVLCELGNSCVSVHCWIAVVTCVLFVLCLCVWVYVCVCVYVCLSLSLSLSVRVCMYVCACVCACVFVQTPVKEFVLKSFYVVLGGFPVPMAVYMRVDTSAKFSLSTRLAYSFQAGYAVTVTTSSPGVHC
jgi:hypothetical protein